MDQFISGFTNALIMLIEIISIFLIMIGVLTTGYNLVVNTLFTRNWANYAQARLMLSRFLLLALEFQIAGDILTTVLKPEWEEFAQLAATIIIRSILSYVLILETKAHA